MPDIDYRGADFELCAEDVAKDLRGALWDCGEPGCDASGAVDFVMSEYDVTGDESDCRAYLAVYGAWEDSELQDHHANLRRLVWLTGCGFREESCAYFQTY